MAKSIPITWVIEIPALGLPFSVAARAVGLSRQTLRRDVARGILKEGPHKTFSVEELKRYSREEGPQQ